MDRRTVLSALGAGAGGVLAGCVSADPDEIGAGEGAGTGGADSPTSGDCGPAAESVGSQLTDEPGDGRNCPPDPEPSLVVENDREASLVATVRLEAPDDRDPFETSLELEPGERWVEGWGVPAADGLEASVDVEGGESWTGSWERRSCKRHAIVVDDGIEVGYVDPLSGPVDTQHDCYAGDGAPLRVYSEGTDRSVAIRIDDRCAGERDEKERELEADAVETISDAVENGGVYDVTIDPEDGSAATYEFREECWGLEAAVDADGSVSVHPMPID